MNCRTPNCLRVAIRDGAYCEDCTKIVWQTGRPPVLPVFVPEWRKHLVAKDMTRSAA